MKKILHDNCFWILFFLALFGFSIGVFNNYRELWMSVNHLSTANISHVISISYLVTVLILFFFTIRVSANKLKWGISISLVIKMITGTILICLNNSDQIFLIKFLMFFDIAFTQLILACTYPLIMNITKNDIIYTKKSFTESLFNKLGFLLVSTILGKTIFHTVVDYNICLLLSIIFVFLAFIVLVSIKVENKTEREYFNVKEAIEYFNKNKVLYFYLCNILLSSIIWSSVLGMPMLTLLNNLNFSSTFASFLILGLGICSNILSMIIVRWFRFKNDQMNLIFKYGIRVILYFLTFITNNHTIFLITIVYLLLSECIYEFIFSGFFINNIDEKYSLLMTTLKYCFSLIGNAIGILLCGIVFSLDIRFLTFPALVIGVVHYALSIILVEKKKVPLKK